MKRNNLQGQVVRLETEKLHLENEIERLNKKIENLEKINNANYQSFIEKNKIIIELEKEIKWQRKICLSLNNYGVGVCDILLNKLQELKGNNNENNK